MAGSTLLAPINMMFNVKFVVFTLLGEGVSWVAQRRGRRDADGTDWRRRCSPTGSRPLSGSSWGVSSFILLPGYFWWLSPVLAGLVLSIPVSIFFSKASVAGRRASWDCS